MNKEFEIFFSDDNMIAVNKPSGMLSIPDRIQSQPSLKDILLQQNGNIFTVHRLDRETSGVIIFARNEQTHKSLSQQFENRETTKHYIGFVLGKPAERKGIIDIPIIEHPFKKGVMVTAKKGKASVTAYEVEEQFRNFALVHFTILTGRTHQIRVHMKHLGHAIVCDDLYGDGKPVLLSSLKKKFNLSKKEEEERPILSRLGLHAKKLIVKDNSGNLLELEAPIPKDMRALLQQLRKINTA